MSQPSIGMTDHSKTDLEKQLRELRHLLTNPRLPLHEIHRKRSGSVQTHSFAPLTVPPLQLVVPSSFHTTVQKCRLSSYAQQALLRALEDTIQYYTHRFDDFCQEITKSTVPQMVSLLPNLVEQFRNSLQHHFETRGLGKLLNVVETYAEEHASSPPHQPTQPHIAPYQPPVPFNNDYTPALEAYFTYDPYPSVKDRQTIASRTGMATRQIEVWFQNHRKRAREQGIVLPDKRSSGGFGDFSGEKERMLDLFNAKPTPATTTPSAATSSSSSSFSFTSSPSPASTPSPTPTPSFSFSFSSSPAPSSVPSTPTAPTFSPSSSSIPHTNTKTHSVVPIAMSLASGTGSTPDDPIHIDTSEMSMSMSREREKERGMTITSAGNGVGVMELDDDVERVARRRERRKGQDGEKEREVREEMRAQRNKLLSVIRPRIRYKRRPSTPNPLDTPTYTSPTAFPTPFTPPPADLQFRNRVTPPSTSFPTLPHSHSPPKNPMSKQEYKETLKTTTSLLSSLSLSSPSPSPPTPPKPQTRIKSLMHAFGAGIDAATCAYTYVLPKAPFWASVSVQPPSQAQRKKPAALGPKRNPRNAPSASPSSASSSRAKPKAVVAKRHSPTPEPGLGGGGGLQRYSSQSSLASTSSSSSSSSSFTYSPPRTPPPSGPEHDSVHIFDPSPSSVFSSPFAFNPIPPTTNPSSSFSSFASHPHPSSPSSFTAPTTTPTSSSSSSIPPGFPEGFVPFSQISSSTMSLPEYYTFATATKPNPKPPVSVSVSESVSMGFDFQVNHHIQDMHAINAFVDGLM
ncbi:hypothetical protein F5878DRAFT_431855 [Lentinula raphanica]|uniref:Homeobox domain-containing protein n=1 Tax=Lentinula raphanica TaxID=153919 RepID=A0AA38NYH7_9AGAR|nr:hypothetical protein F5878DRAFT_431855 [Lentinula raphanica]